MQEPALGMIKLLNRWRFMTNKLRHCKVNFVFLSANLNNKYIKSNILCTGVFIITNFHCIECFKRLSISNITQKKETMNLSRSVNICGRNTKDYRLYKDPSDISCETVIDIHVLYNRKP
jgi:hypothetical protein